jgi:short-subunit dehydrogenase
MYNILLLALSYSLPPLNNVYCGSINFPLAGKQNIEFERLKKNTSQVRLYGLINCKGYVYNDENDESDDNNENDEYNIINTMNYELDNNLINIMSKYRCSIEAPLYDVKNDTILFVLKINMLGLTKSIKLLKLK